MKKNIFRQYDIRGIVDQELLIDQVYDLGRAIAYVFLKINPSVKRVLIGMDSRTHSPDIKERLSNAFRESGLNVIGVGVCPSPVIYFGLHQKKADAGIMITASHNPSEYNGFKLCIGTNPIWGDQIDIIYNAYRDKLHVTADMLGSYCEEDLNTEYVNWMVDHFSDLRNNSIKAFVDCGCATAGAVFPQIVKKLSLNGIKLLCDTVGGECSHQADPTKKENVLDLYRALRNSDDTHLGIAFDGDADRMGAMTGDGKLIPGDILLVLFAQDIVTTRKNNTDPMSVVYDIRSSDGLIELLRQWGVTPRCAPAGNPNIKAHMKQSNAILGGELSCHFMFADCYFGYDDGIYAALRLLEIVIKTGKKLSELIRVFPKKHTSQEFRITCDPEQIPEILAVCKQTYKEKECSVSTLDGVRVACPYGWGLIRPSNTQPVISIRFESDTADGLERISNEFSELLRPFVLYSKLPIKEGGS